ncbi:MAG: hypothetical protein GY932_06295 [Arcobacter sp.]|nr:hypothetical protein [Arcobacter sp.]
MTKNITTNKNLSANTYWVVIAIVVAIGTYFRFKGLGTWTLALDEYYLIKSTENILKNGLPQFDSGGYYARGILIQYMIAPLLSFGVKAEFAGRIFPLLSNLITIPALYLISKKTGNKLIATIVVVIFSLSIWEIEFARFARMYAPFQAIFMWYIYFALIDYRNQNFKNYKWMLLLSVISIFVYEGSVFLSVFNFIPFILNRKIKVGYFFGAVLTFIGSIFINKLGFRYLNSAPIFPPEYSDFIYSLNSKSPIKIPKILFPFAFENILFSALTIILIAVSIFLIIKIIKQLSERNFWSVLSIILLGIFAILNQFGLFILTFLIVVFWNLFEFKLLNKRVIFLLGSLFFLNLIYWFAFGVLAENWYSLFTDFSSYSIWGKSKRLFVGFLNFPDNYYSLINYIKTLPLLTGFSIITTMSLFISLLKQKEKSDIKFLSSSLMFLSLIATIPTLLYTETRYTFFLVPILIILTVYSVHLLANKLFKKELLANTIFTFIILFVFVLSKDFNAYHLLNIDNEEVNYRMIYKSNHIKKHLYRRWDVITPTEFIKKNLQEGDLIIINENSQEYYLPRVDYYNIDYKNSGFIAISVDNGERERWSNAKLIYQNEDLIRFIENRKTTIWFTVFPENWLFDIGFYERYKDYLVCEGIDELVKVYKFTKKNN